MEEKVRPLSWDELVNRCSKRAGTSKAQTERILEAFLSTTTEAVANLEPVRVKGLGTLSAEWREARVLRSPHDRRKMYLDGRYQVRFKVAEGLRRALAEQSPQFWRDKQHQTAWRLAETLVSDLELYHSDKVPKLNSKAPPSEVMERVALALGNHWRRAVQSYEQTVPAEVREAKDHLLEAVLARWSETELVSP